MKKCIKKIVCVLAVLLMSFCLSACGEKGNPTNEELIELFENNEKTKSHFSNPVEYGELTDPNDLLNKEHWYVQKFVFKDKRSSDDNEDYTGAVEVYKNNQDATLRYDKLLLNKKIEDYCQKEEIWFEEEPVYTSQYIHKNGNLIIGFNKSISAKVAEQYFEALDEYLSDNKYKQIDSMENAAFDEFYKTEINTAEKNVDEFIAGYKDAILDSANSYVMDVLGEYEKNLNDDYQLAVSEMMNETLKGKAYDEIKTVWLEKFEELNIKKAEQEKVYQANIDNVVRLIEIAEKNPNQTNYENAKTAFETLDSNNYYYKKSISELKSRLVEIDQRIKEIERDKNVSLIENKLANVEKNLNLNLYEEVVNFIKEYENNSLYKEKISEWKTRLKNIDDAIEKKKHQQKIQEFKNTCKSLKYEEFFRNSSDYINVPVYFKGEVVQVIDQDSKGATLRVNVTRKGYYSTWYTDTVYVKYDNSDDIDVVKILEDDIIQLWGVGAGDISYTSVLGASITIPAVKAYYISVVH